MNLLKTTATAASLLFFVSMAGCDNPELAEKPVASEKKVEASQSNPAPQAIAASRDKNKPEKQAPKPVKPKEREEGVLHVIEKDGKIIVTGSIKSRFEREDLINQLKRGLPGKEIVDELEASPDRYPLGWEGRVAEGILVTFIKVVENAELHYEKGIVRLEGSIYEEKDLRRIQMAVVDTISGSYSRGIENNLVVRKK